MIDYKKLEGILQCPITKEKLSYCENPAELKLSSSLISELQAESGFVNTSQTVFYPIKNNIIITLPEYAITSLESETNPDILSVKSFYDRFGWKKSEDDKYYDNKLFANQETAANKYTEQTTRRINNFLQPQGEYLLDIASGPVYQEEYKSFSENFAHRICIDISTTALEEAQENLKGKNAYFILGDITNIPLQNESCDNVVSMHTLYHVTKSRQLTGLQEMVRVCKPNSHVVIAYNWAWHSMLMNVALLPKRVLQLFGRIKKILFKTTKNAQANSTSGLYFFAHSRKYFLNHQPENARISFSVLKSLHQDFIRIYLNNNERSRKFLERVYNLEEKYPSFFGRHGAFPLIVIEKTAANP